MSDGQTLYTDSVIMIPISAILGSFCELLRIVIGLSMLEQASFACIILCIL